MSTVALVYRLHEIWNTGDIELIHGVYAEHFIAHWPASSEVPERRGIGGVRFGVERIRRAFPDWHKKVLDAFGSGDWLTSRRLHLEQHGNEAVAKARDMVRNLKDDRRQ